MSKHANHRYAVWRFRRQISSFAHWFEVERELMRIVVFLLVGYEFIFNSFQHVDMLTAEQVTSGKLDNPRTPFPAIDAQMFSNWVPRVPRQRQLCVHSRPL